MHPFILLYLLKHLPLILQKQHTNQNKVHKLTGQNSNIPYENESVHKHKIKMTTHRFFSPTEWVLLDFKWRQNLCNNIALSALNSESTNILL